MVSLSFTNTRFFILVWVKFWMQIVSIQLFDRLFVRYMKQKPSARISILYWLTAILYAINDIILQYITKAF